MTEHLSTALAGAARTVAAGGTVAYPTETVWGLAAHPASAAGVARLVSGKGRAPDKPFQVSCADAAVALALAEPSPDLAALSALWPGPLTVVAPASAACPPHLAPGGRVGLRVPAHPVARALLLASGGVLVTTSCNVSGRPPATTEAEARATALADVVLPDGGVAPAGVASTVVELPEGRVVREGSVTADDVARVLAGVRAARRGPA